MCDICVSILPLSRHNLLIRQHKWKVLSTKWKSGKICLPFKFDFDPIYPVNCSNWKDLRRSRCLFDFQITFRRQYILTDVCVCDVMWCKHLLKLIQGFKELPHTIHPSGVSGSPALVEILNFNSCSCRKSLPGDKVDEIRMEISQDDGRGKRTTRRGGQRKERSPQVRVKENKTLCKCATLAVKWNSPRPNYTLMPDEEQLQDSPALSGPIVLELKQKGLRFDLLPPSCPIPNPASLGTRAGDSNLAKLLHFTIYNLPIFGGASLCFPLGENFSCDNKMSNFIPEVVTDTLAAVHSPLFCCFFGHSLLILLL